MRFHAEHEPVGIWDRIFRITNQTLFCIVVIERNFSGESHARSGGIGKNDGRIFLEIDRVAVGILYVQTVNDQIFARINMILDGKIQRTLPVLTIENDHGNLHAGGRGKFALILVSGLRLHGDGERIGFRDEVLLEDRFGVLLKTIIPVDDLYGWWQAWGRQGE